MACRSLRPWSPFSVGSRPRVFKERSSRRGNERMRLKICGGLNATSDATRSVRDFNAGENPWNGIREVTVCSWPVSMVLIVKCTTRENPDNQQSPLVPAAAITPGDSMINVSVYIAGEVEGSVNTVFHDSRSSAWRNRILAKRCFRVRGIHDFETKEQLLSVSLES